MESRCECRYGKLNNFIAFAVCWRAYSVARCSPDGACFVVCAGTRPVRSVIRPLPSSTTGGHRWTITEVTFVGYSCIQSLIVRLFVDPCPGHHLCIRHHKQAVLSAPGQVGQWCGWSKTISTLISLPFTVTRYLYYPSVHCWGSLHTQWLSVSDKMMKSLISVLSVLSFLLFCSAPQTWCRGFW